MTQKFLLKIADYCFTHDISGEYKKNLSYAKTFSENDGNNVGLTDLIGDKIYDYQIAGLEQQVITFKDFFDCLELHGIKFDQPEDRYTVEKVLRLTSTDRNRFIVSNLVTILGSLGIREHRPEDTPFLKHSILRGRDIRIINRLIYVAKKNGIKDIRRIFNKVIFTQKVVSLKESNKNKQIELCSAPHFFEVIKKFGLTKGIELEENLLELLCLSPERQELIMMLKLVKV